jgi:hypothetical protein
LGSSLKTSSAVEKVTVWAVEVAAARPLTCLVVRPQRYPGVLGETPRGHVELHRPARGDGPVGVEQPGQERPSLPFGSSQIRRGDVLVAEDAQAPQHGLHAAVMVLEVVGQAPVGPDRQSIRLQMDDDLRVGGRDPCAY